ncbi:SET domain-containing protein [Myxococcus stipitatus DSM 14675]|uniref:SET domain-containing protein n=1 Tax=Myxococcus stipitatus (strain DSM 14675 / JCM 12634 / Mx s8) TaxID=1278073 RepID=L7U929_MYXSD|nr:SET domain-containing protein-lysine N-methyltransferase [Myxococcus stipitatus]AGC44082.1 SET domain-containing protein [Myxococcus stipitatus DSM 14675]
MTSPTFSPSLKPIPFELRPSSIQGTGAFATRRIVKGERIIEYVGERISQAEADRRYDDEAMERHHTFLFNLDSKTVLDAGTLHNEARYINHSCEPNCEALIDKKRIYVFALRTLEAGEELVYDYAYERTEDMGPESVELYMCRCGAAKCRGTILAPEQQAPARPKSSKKSGKKKVTREKASASKKSRSGSKPSKASKPVKGSKPAKGSKSASKVTKRKKSTAGRKRLAG